MWACVCEAKWDVGAGLFRILLQHPPAPRFPRPAPHAQALVSRVLGAGQSIIPPAQFELSGPIAGVPPARAAPARRVLAGQEPGPPCGRSGVREPPLAPDCLQTPASYREGRPTSAPATPSPDNCKLP